MNAETPVTGAWPRDFCPYKGLQPFTEADRKFFFGRERDQEIIISNLYASQLTVLYGASGVGKSSVLLAGVVPRLRAESRLAVVVFRNWQDPGFLSRLKQCTLEAVVDNTGKQCDIDLALPLDEFLEQAARAVRGSIFFVFDQFEEYFLYNPQSLAADEFEGEFARAVNRKDIRVNFVLSMREDSLSKLDRFQGRIPTLLNNMLRLEHLDLDSAKRAITKPLDEYNRQAGDGQPGMTIENDLVQAVLDDLTSVRVSPELAGKGQIGSKAQVGALTPIETPFLQVVLTRLWEEEKTVGSRVLRLETFDRLGRAENIARTHLDTMMAKLTDAERETAANILRYLVTPSGTKIAQEAGALASWSELPEDEIQNFLNRLSAPDMRILRTVEAPGRPPSYEIFHDVLAQAILNWRTRFVQEKKRLEAVRELEEERAQAEKQLARQRKRAKYLRLISAGMAVLAVIMIVLAVKAYRAKFTAHSRELAAYSRSMLTTDPELSLLLAIEAVKQTANSRSITALRAALLESKVSAVMRPDKTSRIVDVAFSPDGKYLVTASWEDHNAHVWEAATGKSVSLLAGPEGHTGNVNSASFSSDGKYVVTGSLDTTARVWEDWKTNTPRVKSILSEKKDIWSAYFSPDGNYIVTAGGDGLVNVWDWKRNTKVPEKVLPIAIAVSPTPTPVNAVATAPIATTSSNQDLKAMNSQQQSQASSAESGQKSKGETKSTPNAEQAPNPTSSPKPATAILVFKAAFSPADGEYIIIATSNRPVLLWNWKQDIGPNNPLKLKGQSGAIWDAALSHDGKYAVTGSDKATAFVWELKKNPSVAMPVCEQPCPKVILNIISNGISSVAFSPNDTIVATASYDGLARLWDWRSWESKSGSTENQEKGIQPRELRGHTGLLFCIAFSPDGKFVATGSNDGTARVWRTEMLNQSEIDKLSLDELLKLASSRVTRQLTPEEKTSYLDQ